MERGMMGNYHVPCGAGEKLEITSNAYLLQPLIEKVYEIKQVAYTSFI
jgi:hypothetical protein